MFNPYLDANTMEVISALFIFIQVLISVYLLLPLLLMLLSMFKNRDLLDNSITSNAIDYGIIVTAYEQTSLIPFVVESILKSKHDKFIVYVVADKCDIDDLKFEDNRVMILRPEDTLANNIKSHFYAINRFQRPHDVLTIIDSDNLLHCDYLNEMSKFFNNGFLAVQGVRQAKNLDTNYSCLDEAGDMYYRFIDRKLLFDIGSSASLAGSGMAFKTDFYRECLERLDIEGAGFDKVLQIEILNRGERIGFAEQAIVYDEKTSKPKQLVNQRARWINTWFKYASKGLVLLFKGLKRFDANQFFCGLMFSRPPLFILFTFSIISVFLNLFLFPNMLFFWLFVLVGFLFVFFRSLIYFNASREIFTSLIQIPRFVFLQIISLIRARRANELSVATTHYVDKKEIKSLEDKNL